MRCIFFSLVVAAMPFAMANELDRENATAVSQKQVELANELPKTVILRINNKTKEVEIAHVQAQLAPGQKAEKPVFEKMALNEMKTGVPFKAKHELDVTSSTQSWGYGYGRGWGYPGYRGGWAGGGYGYGGYRPYPYYPNYGYGYGAGWGGYCGGYGAYCGGYAWPTYSYVGYSYNFAPYWGYASASYSYTYCGWNGGVVY